MHWDYNYTARLYQLSSGLDFLSVAKENSFPPLTKSENIVFTSLDNVAIPEIKDGLRVSAIFTEDGYTISQATYYDSDTNKVYVTQNRWIGTPHGIKHESYSDPSASHILPHEKEFLRVIGLPNTTRGLLERLLENLKTN
ncbi:MAG TPA: hypothetical protein HA226_01470 [Nanoarchaeota archaeon]|nr:hypothetical protein [Nanoarchaeota archaeon]